MSAAQAELVARMAAARAGEEGRQCEASQLDTLVREKRCVRCGWSFRQHFPGMT
jgi:hypothetical protein